MAGDILMIEGTIDGTSKQAFERSTGQIIRNFSTDERKRFMRAIANLISAGWEDSGSHEGALLRLHGMTADEVIRQGEGMNPGSPLVEGELDGVRYTLYDR